MAFPKLRGVDAYPISVDGESFICLRDPEGVCEGGLILSPAAFFIASLMDGQRGAPDIQTAFAEQFGGVLVRAEDIEKVASELDAHAMLLSPAFEEKRRRIEAVFEASDVRKAYLAGQSYPTNREELTRLLDGYFTSEKGPGLIEPSSEGTPVRLLVSPHIDFHRGGWCYAWAYRELLRRCDAETFIILGVAHASPPTPFVLCRKSFQTPLGTAPLDEDLADRIVAQTGNGILEHHLVHRTEHSIEFQVVFLQHVLKRAFRIVPILCSSFEPFCHGADPSSVPEIERFIILLADILESSPRRICLVAGVDLAHVGPRFGDPEPVGPQLTAWMEDEDRKSLERLLAADADGFWTSVMADGNRRKVCGLTALYTALRLVPGTPGRRLRYGHAPDPAGGLVSFTSAVFPAR